MRFACFAAAVMSAVLNEQAQALKSRDLELAQTEVDFDNNWTDFGYDGLNLAQLEGHSHTKDKKKEKKHDGKKKKADDAPKKKAEGGDKKKKAAAEPKKDAKKPAPKKADGPAKKADAKKPATKK